MILIKVKKEDNLINYLVNYEGLSFNKIKQLLRKKDIKLNDKRVNEDTLVKINDNIILYAKENYFFDIKIIYNDNNIIVVDKPKKLEVISENKNIDLIRLINKDYFAVHRLDFNTEGLVIIAKNLETKNELDNEFKKNNIEKYYITICKNIPKNKEITFINYLEKNDKFVKIYKVNVKNSKKCITKIELIKNKNNFSLLKVNILTGRTHQIRAQLAFNNLFVLGDEKYGDFSLNKKLNLKNQILKCIKLKFNFENNSFLNYLNNINFETNYNKIEELFNNI